jgi:hypothetical protein
LLGSQVRVEAQSFLKVVSANLDARFSDLERGFGHRMRPSFHDNHAQVRRFLMQLAREAAASQAAAENRHVEEACVRHATVF